MSMKIIKVCATSFTGDDGKEVKGQHVYLVSDTGDRNERLFLSDDKLAKMEYKPKFGDAVHVFKNGYDRVVDIVKA